MNIEDKNLKKYLMIKWVRRQSCHKIIKKYRDWLEAYTKICIKSGIVPHPPDKDPLT